MLNAASAPSSLAYFVSSTALSVLLDPAPAITFILPFTSSTTIFITFSCSEKVSVGASPVVPQGTIPAVPFSTELSMPRKILQIS